MTESHAAPLPVHIGLILDGNRRWAREHGLPLMEGHRRGYENLKTIARYAFESGIQYVSAYVFSTENWKRSKNEVAYLMKLLAWVLKHEVDVLHKEGRRVRVLGSELGLSKGIIKAIQLAEKKTQANTNGTLLLCLNYGGQQEIADAVKQIIAGSYRADQITPQLISQFLYKPDVPPIDLVIRASGEQRLSNFMLWRTSYSELLFVAKHWPAFNKADLQQALDIFAERQRRFGS